MDVKKFPVQPSADRIIVLVVEAPDKTAGGIYIPETGKEKPLFAQVKAVGSKVLEYEPSMVIMHGKFAGTDINIDGIDYLLMRQEEVLGTVVDMEIAESLVAGRARVVKSAAA